MARVRGVRGVAWFVAFAVAAAACSGDGAGTAERDGIASASAVAASATPASADELEASDYRAAAGAARAGRHAEAAARYAQAQARGGTLAGFAALRGGEALAATGDAGGAAAAFALAAVDASLPGELRTRAARGGADAAARAGRLEEALALLGAVGRDWPAASTERASARWRSAELRREAGDGGWTEDALAAIAQSAGAPASPLALAALEAAGVAVPPLTAALVRYRARDNARAGAAYAMALATPLTAGEAAEAWFYRGALAERADRVDEALTAYASALERAPAGPLADDARWWRGLLLEQAGELEAATAEFDALAGEFPGSAFAADARLRAALAVAARGRGAEAGARLRAIAATAARDDAASAARWLGALGLREAGDLLPAAYDAGSAAALLEAAGGARVTVPAAAVRERPGAPAPSTGAAGPELAAVTSWVAGRYGPAAEEIDVGALPAVALARRLGDVGEGEAGRAVLAELLPELRGRPHGLVALAGVAGELGAPDVALGAAARLLGPLPTEERLQAPRALLGLAYPAPFAAAVTAAADAEGLPPLLLLALVRQESAFHARAGSVAGALGLTQVIPATGRQLAEALRVEWSPELLYDPATSLRFGARYLGEQLRRFDGDVAAALAAYNAGPAAAERWRRAQRFPGTDGFIDAIEFAETRLYVASVLEHYAWYRVVYAGAAELALPRER